MKDYKGNEDTRKRETMIFSGRKIVRATNGYYKCGIVLEYLQWIRKINYTFKYK